MLYLILARVRINAGHNKVSVICKFKNTVSVVNRMQIGRSDNVGRWAYLRSLNDAGVDDGDC